MSPRAVRRVRVVLALLVAWAALTPASFAQAPPDGSDERFGMVLVPPDAVWLDRAYRAGARVNRFQLNWWDVEPAPGQRTFDAADRAVETITAAGLEVTLLLTAPPAWARRPGSDWVPAGLDRPWDDPANAWGAFVYATVERFKGRVRYYEMYNEPDLDRFWDGSPEEYAALLATAYRAAKAADPDAQVIIAGMAHWSRPQFAEQVLHALRQLPDAAANNHFFDIAAWHWYSRADQLYGRVLWARDLLVHYGMGSKPIWINETNIPVWGDGAGPQEPMWGFGSTAEQAAFMIQAFTNAFAAGAERVFVFRLHDNGMDETFGLMRDDGTPRPAYQAYMTAARWLAGARFVTREVRGGVVLTVFRRAPDEKITVAWTTGEERTNVLIEAAAGEATLVNLLGDARTILATEGLYNLGLDGGSIYTRPADGQREQLVGGPPVMLVERDQTPPLLRLDPLPALSAAAALPLAWQIENPSDAPIERIEFQVRTDEGTWTNWQPTSSGTAASPPPAGSTTFTGEVGHRYEFRARAVAEGGRTTEWPPSDQPMAATLVGAAVVGAARDARDLPLVDLRVCAAPGYSSRKSPCTRTDEAGFFRLSPLPAGRLTVTAPRFGHITATITTTLGQESVLPTLRVVPDENVVADGDMERVGGKDSNRRSGWAVEPVAGAETVVEEEQHAVARIQAGTRLAQHLTVPTTGEPVLSVRYRVAAEGAPLQVGIYHLTESLRFTRLLLDGDTRGEWRDLWFDMTPFAGQDIILELAATGSRGRADVDEVRLGPSTIPSALFLPLIQGSDPSHRPAESTP